MSSKQITELLNECRPVDEQFRHDNVKRTMERLADREVIRFTPMEETSNMPNGGSKKVEVYLVNERDSYVVVAQLSPEFAAAIVDHWRKLKGENAELKVQVAALGRKMDGLCAVLLNPLVTVNPTPVSQEPTPDAPKRRRRKHRWLTKDDVIRVNHMFSVEYASVQQICDKLEMSSATVNRVLRGDRDYLLPN